jgi:putative transcription factor
MSYNIEYDSSLWNEVTILKKKNINQEQKKKAIREGNTVTQDKKKMDSIHKNRKLDENNDAAKHKTITKEQARLIIDARTVKKWKQKDLAREINEPCKVINDYECCKAIPDSKIITKLQKKLNIKLRIKK